MLLRLTAKPLIFQVLDNMSFLVCREIESPSELIVCLFLQSRSNQPLYFMREKGSVLPSKLVVSPRRIFSLGGFLLRRGQIINRCDITVCNTYSDIT